MVKLERVGETAPGVNRTAEVEDQDVDNWVSTGAWKVAGKTTKPGKKAAKQGDDEPAGTEDDPLTVDQAADRAARGGGKKKPRKKKSATRAADG